MISLVSFCNQVSSPFHSLCAVGDTGEVLWIDLSLIEAYAGSFAGISGICIIDDLAVIATQGEKPVLALLDIRTTKLIACSQLCKCKDTHSLVFHAGYIYAVSTGTNEIYRIPFWDRNLGEEELYWRYPDVQYDRDEIHLNGLTLDGERLIASCFGERDQANSWSSNGRLFYLDTGESIKDGLLHPHTPLIVDDFLFIAESAAYKVYVYKRLSQDGWALDKVAQLHGYTRGLAYKKGELLVGISASRKMSRSKKTVSNNLGPSDSSSLVRVDVATGTTTLKMCLQNYGREVYDIVLPLDWPVLKTESVAVTSRLEEMEAVLDRYAADAARLTKQDAQQLQAITNMQAGLTPTPVFSGTMANNTVSVIIPTFNRASFIGDAIRSVLSQTYSDIELIVIDDGSSDNTPDVVSTFSDPRLRYIRQANMGRSNARNHALSLAKGRYIAFLDSDDLFLPDKLERQVAYLQSHPGTGMVYTSAHCIDHKGSLLEHKYLASVSGCIYEKIAFFTPVTITLPTVMTYKAIMDHVGDFDEDMHRFEDTDMWRRISKVCRIDAMAEFTCLLRTHDDNTLVNQNAEQIASAVDYYAAKIMRDDVDIELSIRCAGLAGLYGYYGHALCSVPRFSDIGKRLLVSAKNYDSNSTGSKSRIASLWRFIYYRPHYVSYRIYRYIKRLIRSS